MRSSTFLLCLFLISFLAFCVVFMIKNKDYLSAFDFTYMTKNSDEDYVDSLMPEQNEAECKFGFGFLRKLVPQPKLKSQTESHAALFQRPIAGALIQESICVDSMDGIEGNGVSMGECHGQGRNQEWTLMKNNQIRSEGRGFLCLAWNLTKKHTIFLQRCNSSSPKQKWLFNAVKQTFIAAANPKLCVESIQNRLQVSKCKFNSASQKWKFIMTEILNIKLQAQNQS